MGGGNRLLWLDRLDVSLHDTELVAEWVCHDGGAEAAIVVVQCKGFRADLVESHDFRVEVVDEQIEVSAVLDDLGLIDALERQVVQPSPELANAWNWAELLGGTGSSNPTASFQNRAAATMSTQSIVTPMIVRTACPPPSETCGNSWRCKRSRPS